MEAMEPMDMEASKDSVDTDISRDRLGCLLETEGVNEQLRE